MELNEGQYVLLALNGTGTNCSSNNDDSDLSTARFRPQAAAGWPHCKSSQLCT
jgi:hypothetical protein